MAVDQKLTQLTEATSVDAGDLLYVVKDPSGSPVSRKITVSNLKNTMGVLASEVAFTPYGGILATDVQSALQELDDEKVVANGAITGNTKTKITYDAKGLVTSGADATTADIADSTDRRYVTDAQLVVIGNTSGTNTGDQDLSGLVPKSLFDANTVLYATADDTPLALTVNEQTVVGRATGGAISALLIDSDLSSVSSNNDTIPSALAVKTVTDGKENFHGVQAYGSLSFNDSTHEFTMAAGTNTYWYQGVKYTTSGAITCDLDSYVSITANTVYYVYFDDASGTLKASASAWDLHTKVPVATVFWNGTNGLVQLEAHNHTRDIDWHIWAHDTVGTRYETGLVQTYPSTSVDSQIQIETGVVHDEDLDVTITQQTNARLLYQASAGIYTWQNVTLPYAGSLGSPQYLDTDTYTLTNAGAAKYINVWVYACLDTSRNIWLIPTHATDPFDTVGQARSATPPNLAGLNLNAEMKLIYRWIYKGDGEFQEATDYRTSSPVPAGGSTAITASAVSFVPYGDISSTNVQAALQELDDEKSGTSHTHYYLVASDGSPDPALTCDASGDVNIQSPVTIGKLNVGGDVIFANGYAQDVYIDVDTESINCGYQDSDVGSLTLNATGYLGGTDYVRNVCIGDALGNTYVQMDGTSKSMRIGYDSGAYGDVHGVLHVQNDPTLTSEGQPECMAFNVGNTTPTSGSYARSGECKIVSDFAIIGDDVEIDLSSVMASSGFVAGTGYIMISDPSDYSAHVSHVNFCWDIHGINVTNVVGAIRFTDTDGFFCVYVSGGLTIKNRLGASTRVGYHLIGFDVTSIPA